MSQGEVLRELAELRASLDATIHQIEVGSRTIAEVFSDARENSAIGYLYAVKAMEADPRGQGSCQAHSRRVGSSGNHQNQ